MKELIENFKERYGTIIMPIALIGGFVADIFTLNQIDQTFDNAILIAHIIIVATTIALLFSKETPFGMRFLTSKRVQFLRTLMVFSFGALFSGFVIFYTRSGSLLTSWPFIISMLALMLGTEFRKKYFHKLQFQIIIFAVAIVSWSIFFVPVVIKKMGGLIFFFSTMIGLGIIFLFLLLLRKINKGRIKTQQKRIVIHIIGIILLFNVLYFTNILPPIPLSLKYKAVYYEVEKQYPVYKAQYEKTAWYIFWRKRSRNMYWREGEDIFIFTQVFAPTRLKTTIQHVWEYYNEPERRWEESNRISIPITGGRKEGYRGFSKKTNFKYGIWRVKIQTSTGQTLGFIRFEVKPYGENIRELVYEEL